MFIVLSSPNKDVMTTETRDQLELRLKFFINISNSWNHGYLISERLELRFKKDLRVIFFWL